MTKQPETDANKLLEETIDYFTRVERTTLNRVNRDLANRNELMNKVAEYLHSRNIDDELINVVLQLFHDYVYGYHILETLINDETISDIKIISYDNIRIKVNGKRRTSDVKFNSDDELRRFVEYIAIKNKVNLSDNNAIPTFTDKNSNPKFILRLEICSPFVNSVPNYYLIIRKISKVKKGMDHLIKVGMLDEEISNYLIKQAKNARGILFTGKGASGKTTLMNELLEYVPVDRSGLAIQENEELFSDIHPDIMFQHIVTNRGEGKIQYELKDLARNALLLDLDYFIIGEIKGDEAVYFLNAAYTGHQCWASVHGVSSTEAIDKLADYAMHASNYSKTELMKMLKTMEVVVFMENFTVKEISEVVRFDEATKSIVYKRVL